MKVLIAAGGTGGHIYPGIAVAKEIMRRDENSEVRFVGTSRGLETKIVPANGFELSLINSAGLKSVGLVGKIKGLAILPKSFLEARQIDKRISAGCRSWRGRLCFGSGSFDGEFDASSDTGDGFERAAGFYESKARAVCYKSRADV